MRKGEGAGGALAIMPSQLVALLSMAYSSSCHCFPNPTLLSPAQAHNCQGTQQKHNLAGPLEAPDHYWDIPQQIKGAGRPAIYQNTAKTEALYAEGLWKGIAEWNLIVNRAPHILKFRP